MATGTLERPFAIETGQVTPLITFSSIANNTCVKIGNFCFVEFTGIVGQSLGVWTDCVKLPFGINANEEVMGVVVYNDTLYSASIHEASGDTNMSIQSSMASGKKLSISMCYIATA